MEWHLPARTSLRRRRRKDAVTSNQDIALADERSLLSLTIPASLLEPWKFFAYLPKLVSLADERIFLATERILAKVCAPVALAEG